MEQQYTLLLKSEGDIAQAMSPLDGCKTEELDFTIQKIIKTLLGYDESISFADIHDLNEDDINIFNMQLVAQWKGIDGFISKRLVKTKDQPIAGYRQPLMLVMKPKEQLASLSGLPQLKFLFVYLYSIIKLYASVKNQLLKQDIFLNDQTFLTILRNEIYVAANAYLSKKSYHLIYSNTNEINPNEATDAQKNKELYCFIANYIFSLEKVMREGDELILPCGFNGHSIYLAFLRLNTKLSIRIDNVGKGHEKFNKNTNGEVDLNIIPDIDLSNSDDQATLQSYLVAICKAKYALEDDAIPIIYNQNNQFKFSVQNGIDYGFFSQKKQIVDNCTAENFLVGMTYRFLILSKSKKKRLKLFDWIFNKNIEFASTFAIRSETKETFLEKAIKARRNHSEHASSYKQQKTTSEARELIKSYISNLNKEEHLKLNLSQYLLHNHKHSYLDKDKRPQFNDKDLTDECLEHGDFSYSDFIGTDFRDSKMKKTKFNNSNLRGAKITRCKGLNEEILAQASSIEDLHASSDEEDNISIISKAQEIKNSYEYIKKYANNPINQLNKFMLLVNLEKIKEITKGHNANKKFKQ